MAGTVPQPTPAGTPAGVSAARETRDERRARLDSDEMRSLRERVADTRARSWIARRRPLNEAYRVAVGLVGAAVVVLGLALVPLPGPGWFIVFGGLFVLATEFTWAERLLDYGRRRVRAWTEWLGRQAMWVRGVVAVATAAFVYAVVVVTLRLAGVPDWMPGWVPLWR